MPTDQVITGDEQTIASEESFPAQDGVSIDALTMPASIFLSF